MILTPDLPHFYYVLGGNLGSLLYGDVSVMHSRMVQSRVCCGICGFNISAEEIRCVFDDI